MKIRPAASFALVLAACAWLAPAARAQSLSGQTPEADARSWKEYAPEGEGFSVLAPGAPRRRVEETPLGEGQTTELYIHSLTTPTAEYGVIYADYPFSVSGPEMAKRILDNMVKGAVASVNAEVLELSETTLGGRPGRALKGRLPDGKIMRVRLYLDGSRIYQAAVTTPDEKGMPAASVKLQDDAAAKFLDSFKLTGTRTQAPPPPPPLMPARKNNRQE